MSNDVKRDFDRSVTALRTVVFPVLQQHCADFRDMEVMVLPRAGDPLYHDLDVIAGIDAYQRSQSALRTIAARVQYVAYGRPYRTFTIRTSRPHQHAATELKKRLSQLAGRDAGFLYPYWTVHAYLSQEGTALYSVALVKTSELYFWIAQCSAQGESFAIRSSPDGEDFLVVPWDHYRSSGNFFFEYPCLQRSTTHGYR